MELMYNKRMLIHTNSIIPMRWYSQLLHIWNIMKHLVQSSTI